MYPLAALGPYYALGPYCALLWPVMLSGSLAYYLSINQSEKVEKNINSSQKIQEAYYGKGNFHLENVYKIQE